jgi:uncharacterized protein YjbI with pentapeptide repeats
MDRSRLPSSMTVNAPLEDPQSAPNRTRTRLPLFLIVSSVILGGIWFFQQTGVRHLNERIYQLQQDIDRLPDKIVTPIERIGLEKEQITLEHDRLNAQNDVYNLLFQGIGATLLGGIIYTGWQYLRRTEARFQHHDEQQISDRFSQAIAHLASDKMEIRLGGIYLLERLAQESPAEHWTTIEVLTAFVRERSTGMQEVLPAMMGVEIPPAERKVPHPRIPTDIQAVMTVLSRRDVSQDRPDRIIQLRESNLRAADLNGVELWGADLWKVNLREAQLWQAKLVGAFLGRANLSEASLWQADLTGAYLWKANLEGANLTEANLTEANLEGSNLKSANLHQTNLINADLRKVVGLTRKQISKAICDETTQLPDYLELIHG